MTVNRLRPKYRGAALEFSLEELGSPSDVRLYLNDALCEATWDNGTTLKTFVHATEPVGWFVFENLPLSITPALISPKYSTGGDKTGNSVEGQDLRRLGYKQGTIDKRCESDYLSPGRLEWFFV